MRWDAVLAEVARQRGFAGLAFEAPAPGDPALLYPDLTPDRFGSHLARAWSAVRAGCFFRPWHQASAATAIPFDAAAITPERLAAAHLALLQARSARAFHTATGDQDGNS